MKLRRMSILCILVMLFSLCMVPMKAEAATPRLMITDYKVSGDSVVGGKDFNFTLTLKNMASQTTIKNIKVTISTENGEILPVEGAGTAYIEKLSANTEEEVAFKLKAVKGLEEKSYKLSIKLEYESNSGMEYVVDESIFLPITMEQRLSVTDLYVADNNVHIGESVEVTAKINNLGEGSLYNVEAILSGDGVEEMKSFVGTIEPGKSGNLDLLAKASEVTYATSKSKLTIVYEDKEGKQQQKECDVIISVSSPLYDELELIKGEEKQPKDWTVVKWSIVVVIVVVIVAVLLIRKAKRKKKILEEF